jgi:hypothetical protein
MSLTYDYLSNDQKRNTFVQVDLTQNSNFVKLDVATTSLKFYENELPNYKCHKINDENSFPSNRFHVKKAILEKHILKRHFLELGLFKN